MLVGVNAVLLSVGSRGIAAGPCDIATIEWDGGASTTSWHAPANWTEDRLPGHEDHVCIPEGSVTVTHTSGATSVRSIGVESALSLSGGSLAITDTQVISTANRFDLTGSGVLGGAATLTVQGDMLWNRGTMTGPGTTAVAPGAKLNINHGCCSATQLGAERTIANDGLLNWSGYVIDAHEGSRIENSGTFEIHSNEWIGNRSGAGKDPKIVNEGTIIKHSTGNTGFDAVFHNEGTVVVNAGSLNVSHRSPSYLPAKRLLAEGAYVLKGRLAIANANVSTNAARIVLDGTSASLTDMSGVNALRNLARNTAAGRIELRNGASLGTTGPVTNLGKITIGPSSTLTTAGRYLQTGGATVLEAASSRIVPTGAAVELRTGSLRGIGTVQGELRNPGGTVMPGAATPGTLTVSGAFVQGANGLLLADVAGSAAADKLEVVGAATLGGTLQTVVARTYAPVVDERFRLIAYASSTGSFDSVAGQRLASGTLLWIEKQPTGTDAVVRIDDGGQWGTVAINGGDEITKSPAVTLTITADPARSITGMRVANDVAPSGVFQPFATTLPWTLAGDGTRKVYVELRDDAGNRSAVFVDSIVLDTKPPAVEITPPLDAAAPLTLTFTEPVTGARAGNVFVEDASRTRIAATLACLGGDGALLSCSGDFYRRIELIFDSDLDPGEYRVVVNPAGATALVADKASNAVATTTKSFGI